MAGVRVEESPQGRRVEPEDRVQSGPASKPKLTRKLPNDRLFAGRFLRAAAPVTGSTSRSREQLATGSRMSAPALMPVRPNQTRLAGRRVQEPSGREQRTPSVNVTVSECVHWPAVGARPRRRHGLSRRGRCRLVWCQSVPACRSGRRSLPLVNSRIGIDLLL